MKALFASKGWKDEHDARNAPVEADSTARVMPPVDAGNGLSLVENLMQVYGKPEKAKRSSAEGDGGP